MKLQLASIFLMAGLVWACSQSTKQQEEDNDYELSFYGEKIEQLSVVAAADVRGKLETADSVELQVEGIITEVCKKKGCWMKIDMGNGESLTVRFKDYGFFVPVESQGKIAVIDGVLKKEINEHHGHHHDHDHKEGEACHQDENVSEFVFNFTAKGVILKEDKI
ncbi:MAG: DUF4920 domain-containing protein [Cyclobacteriaceae bacterium]|nr:DUF4920 domain-containing protein [Cyclobacteriaceae bacterium]